MYASARPNLLLMSTVTHEQRVQIVQNWLCQQDQLTQREYLARVEAESGLKIAPRTLRSWLQDLNSIGNPEMSALVRAAFRASVQLQATLGAIVNTVGREHEVCLISNKEIKSISFVDADSADPPQPGRAAGHEGEAAMLLEAPAQTAKTINPEPKKFEWDLD